MLLEISSDQILLGNIFTSRPSTSLNDDKIENVKEPALANRRIGNREIVQHLNIYVL